MRWITSVIVVLGLCTGLVTATPYVLPVIQNRNIWAAMSLIAILLFTSGHMFNQIRKIPYVVANGRGGVTYFAAGFQNQLGVETQVVAGLCRFFLPIPIQSLLTVCKRCSSFILCYFLDC